MSEPLNELSAVVRDRVLGMEATLTALPRKHSTQGSAPDDPNPGDTWDDQVGNVKMYCPNSAGGWTAMFTYEGV